MNWDEIKFIAELENQSSGGASRVWALHRRGSSVCVGRAGLSSTLLDSRLGSNTNTNANPETTNQSDGV